MNGLCCVVWFVEEEWGEEIDHESDFLISGIYLYGRKLFMYCLQGAVNLQVSWREEGVERVAANARTGKNG